MTKEAFDKIAEGLHEALAEAPKITMTDGSPVTDDHREIDPATGMQKGYVVLSEEERAKGFVRPYRDMYRHLHCKGVTTMGRTLSETLRPRSEVL